MSPPAARVPAAGPTPTAQAPGESADRDAAPAEADAGVSRVGSDDHEQSHQPPIDAHPDESLQKHDPSSENTSAHYP